VFGEILLARGALAWAPGAATGMTVGAQVPQPQPTPVVTTGVRTKVHGGIHGTGAAVRWWHGVRWHQRRCGGMRSIALTQGTVGLMREAHKRFGLVSAGVLGWQRLRLGGRGWGRHASLGPGDMHHEEEPDEGQQSKLVVKKV